MTKKQTRRTVSMSAVRHAQLKEYCDVTGRTMSDLVDDCLEAFFTSDIAANIILKSHRDGITAEILIARERARDSE